MLCIFIVAVSTFLNFSIITLGFTVGGGYEVLPLLRAEIESAVGETSTVPSFAKVPKLLPFYLYYCILLRSSKECGM